MSGKWKHRFWQVLNRWFWLNYAIALALTTPLPMLNITVNGELARRVPVWECYRNTFQGRGTKWDLFVLMLHLGMSFVICFVVWWMMTPQPIKNRKTPPEPACDTGASNTE